MENDQEIKIGERHTLQSKVLNEERPYWVYLPGSYRGDSDATRRYIVLYLLDGDMHFHTCSGIVQFMSLGGNIQIPELIIVAIPNTDRTRDLTPTHTKIGYGGEETDSQETSGGGDLFLRFMKEELFPQIDAAYRTLPYRVLVGHSYGGLLALHAFLAAPKMFQSYIAIDPSLWWDNQILCHRVENWRGAAQKQPASVYISMANNPDIGFGDPTIMSKATRKFAASLESTGAPNLRSTLEYFEAEDHGSVPLLSLYHGLLYIFEGYKPTIPDFLEQSSNVTVYYECLSQRLGVHLLPPEAVVNELGYIMLDQIKNVENAIKFFKLNTTNYPDSANTFHSLGDAYRVKGEADLAIENYKRSLTLNPDNQNAEKQIQALQSQSELK